MKHQATTSAKPVLGTANAVHQKSLRPRDAELGSFGRLSRIGLYQALDLGAWLQGFYAPAHNAAIRATSSNYARTINTAQAVLRNFLPGDAPAGALPVRVHINPKSNSTTETFPSFVLAEKYPYGRVDAPFATNPDMNSVIIDGTTRSE